MASAAAAVPVPVAPAARPCTPVAALRSAGHSSPAPPPAAPRMRGPALAGSPSPAACPRDAVCVSLWRAVAGLLAAALAAAIRKATSGCASKRSEQFPATFRRRAQAQRDPLRRRLPGQQFGHRRSRALPPLQGSPTHPLARSAAVASRPSARGSARRPPTAHRPSPARPQPLGLGCGRGAPSGCCRRACQSVSAQSLRSSSVSRTPYFCIVLLLGLSPYPVKHIAPVMLELTGA